MNAGPAPAIYHGGVTVLIRSLSSTLQLVLVGLCASSWAFCSQASGTAGTVQGTVLDPTSALVAGASVTLSNPVTGYQKEVTTGNDGDFRFVNVPPNHYHLQISAPGFSVFQQDLDVRSAVPQQLKATLSLATANETVEVSASADMIENVPAAHTDVNENLINNLPVNSTGQGLSDVVTLTAGGVVADSNGFFHPQGDHGETTYVVDGQPITDQQNKTFSTQLPANAFQSLELISNSPNAEYGEKTGLIVNATTRSGLGSKPTGSFETYYGSFGTIGEDFTFGVGGPQWGNFFVADSSRTGRFLDTPEFMPFHDIGNSENIFDRIDYQPTGSDSIHVDLDGARNWFQIPDTYDQLSQDQRQEATTISLALGYQHTFNPQTLLTINPFYRQDHVQYFPSRDPFADTPATIGEDRHLTNWGTRIDLSYAKGINNIKAGTEVQQTRLNENFGFGLTDPAFNAVCETAAGGAVLQSAITDPAACAGQGYFSNPSFVPGLLAYDLSRGGSLFHFTGSGNINLQAVYVQDQITIKNLTLTPGLRFDNYDGVTQDHLVEPRIGISYLLKPTNTVLRANFDRTMETPYNENLLLSSSTGQGGLASTQFGGYGSEPLRPGHRTDYGVGLEQAAGRFVQISGDYFWKYTQNAFDFDTLFSTPITFPIEWRQSKIDGVSARIATRTMKGFQAYTTVGHTRARFFGPENGGLVFNSPLNVGAFRIDHDQAFQETAFLRYQYGKQGPWAAFTWRFDSGEVAGAVTDLADALALDGDQQATIGFYCGTQVATLLNPIKTCTSSNYGATRLVLPAPGTYNPDHNPPRVAPRNLFDASAGIDNLLHTEKVKMTLKLTVVNLTNEAALYNFLSTFSGTHWVSPRTYQATVGWNY